MPIIIAEIMKTKDERKLKNTTKQKKQGKQKKADRSKGNRCDSERVRAKWFCFAFKLDFLQLICKASSILKLNLDLVLSSILKQRESYESKHVVVESRCLEYETCYPFWYALQC